MGNRRRVEVVRTEGVVVVSLQAENVKRLRAVFIEPKDNVVVISGANGAGKTSVLDSIMFTLAGERSIQDEPLRQGATKGRSTVTLSNGLVVTRTYTKKGGGTLVIRAADGAKYGQKELNEFLGRLSFDPLAFARADSKKRIAMLQELTGSAEAIQKLEEERKREYDARTDVNREVSRLEAQLASLPEPHPSIPTEEVGAATILREQREAQAVRTINDRRRDQLNLLRAKAVTTQKEVDGIREKMDDLEKRLNEAVVRLESERDKIEAEEKIVSALRDPDTGSFEGRLREIEETNQKIRLGAKRKETATALSKARCSSDEFTSRIERIEEEKRKLLSESNLPVKGLTFDSTLVRIDGIPFDQVCTSGQLKASIGIGLKSRPKDGLNVLLIRDGCHLDAEGMGIVAELAREAGAQVWVERVGSEPGSIEIVDGAVAGSDEEGEKDASPQA
jgi:DNA repair exonuclease SbcCD ATPase subunit